MLNDTDQDDFGIDDLVPSYDAQPPYLKRFWDICATMLDMGLKPTPGRINEVLGKPKRTSLNGEMCRIRSYLLYQYGYRLVEKSNWRGSYWRWEKP